MIFLRLFCGHRSGGGGGEGVSENPQTSLEQGTYDRNIEANVEKLADSPLKSGIDYNIGGKVPQEEFKHPVRLVLGNAYVQSVPEKGEAYSVYKKLDNNGNLYSERFYDGNGYSYLDIDYTDHHRPKKHTAPHYHTILWDENGKFKRSKQHNVQD